MTDNNNADVTERMQVKDINVSNIYLRPLKSHPATFARYPYYLLYSIYEPLPEPPINAFIDTVFDTIP